MNIDSKRRRLVTAGALFAAVPGSGAGQPDGAPVRLPKTLAVTHGPHALPVLIAERLGLFAAEGLPLRVLHFQVGRIGLERLLAGEVQFATVADAPIMFASLKRTDFSMLATMTRSVGDNSMVVRNDRGINRPADLRGKRIGTARGSGGHFFADTFLLYNGLTTADVVLVAMEPQQVAPALAAQVRWAVREKLVPAPQRAPEFLDMVRVEPLRQVDPRAVRLVR